MAGGGGGGVADLFLLMVCGKFSSGMGLENA